MKKIFVSYAHADRPYEDALRQRLRGLTQNRAIELWVDLRLSDGVEWREELFRQIDESDAFFILASDDYLASDFIQHDEWPRIRSRLKGRKLFWLSTSLEGDGLQRLPPELLNVQSVSGDGRSLRTLYGEHSQDSVWIRVYESVRAWTAAAGATPVAATEPVPAVSSYDTSAYLEAVADAYRYASIADLGDAASRKEIRRLPLDSVYVALQADPTTIEERLQTRALYHELAGQENPFVPWNERLGEILRQREDHMPTRGMTAATRDGDRLEEIFRKERVLVVLGDPGSGKSMMCRRIARQMAEQRLDSTQAHQTVAPDLSLGLPRIPILIRVSKFAAHVQSRPAGSTPSEELFDFLGEHVEELVLRYSGLSPKTIGDLCRQAIEAKNAVVLIDGLDEVENAAIRGKVCDAVDHFIGRRILSASSTFAERVGRDAAPGDVGGNQVVLTSRITGYHLAPLRTEAAAHFIIRPLNDDQVRQMCVRVAIEIDETPEMGEELAKRLAATTDAGLERLKRNPLLLTSLVKYAAIRRDLPATRSELYRSLILDLSSRFRAGAEPQHGFNGRLAEEDNLLRILAKVADEIHHKYPNGRITKRQLANVMFGRVAAVTENPLTRPDEESLRAEAKRLLDVATEQSGALVELGTDIYGFVHLTFQEYLVGWKLADDAMREHSDDVAAAFAGAFGKHLDDPRWREPLLFAFGELARRTTVSPDAVSVTDVLERLRTTIRQQWGGTLADEAAFVVSELLSEVSPQQVSEQVVRQVLLALLQQYATCARAAAATRRERIAERIAGLRRRSETLKTTIDALLRDVLLHEPELTAPAAHLLWERRWLSAATLESMASRRAHDSALWNWPILTALRQSVPDNMHVDVEPRSELAPPAQESTDDSWKAKARYDAGFEAWHLARLRWMERESGVLPPVPLRTMLEEDSERWQRWTGDPHAARLTVALLGAVDDVEAIRWRRDYSAIANFLQKGDAERESIIDAQPAPFVTRFGCEDIIYRAAVYLDNDPDGRFKRRRNPLQISPRFVVERLPANVEKIWSGAVNGGFDELEDQFIVLEQDHDPEVRACACVALTLLGRGITVGAESIPALQSKVARTLNALEDAVFRSAQRALGRWFVEREEKVAGPALSDGESAALFERIVASGAAAFGNSVTAPLETPRQTILGATVLASRWAHAFVDGDEDWLYQFAVALNELAPQPEGPSSARPLLARILTSQNSRYSALAATRAPAILWGVSSAEKLVPPEFFHAVEDAADAAMRIDPGLGFDFAKQFLQHLPAQGVVAEAKASVMRSFAFALVETEADDSIVVESGHLRARRRRGKTDVDAVAAMADPIEAAQAIEELLSSGEIHLDEHIAGILLRLAEKLRDHPLDRCLFLARGASRHAPERSVAIPLWKAALENVAEIGDPYETAEFLARIRTLIAAEPELAAAHRRACRLLQSQSAILGAHAEGRLGRYLCHNDFPWNADGATSSDPDWIVLSAYSALEELREELNREDAASDDVVIRLLQTNGDSFADLLLNPERKVICTERIATALTGLAGSSPRETAFIVDRVTSLLRDATSEAMPIVESWVSGDPAVRQQPSTPLARTAAVLLYERDRSLSPLTIDPLFEAIQHGDDIQAFHAEIALAGMWRKVERNQRRFSLRRNGDEAVRILAARYHTYGNQLGRHAPKHLALLALNDWVFDDEACLGRWCADAAPGTEEESVLLRAVAAVDIWSPACQSVFIEWGTATAARTLPFLHWAARLSTLGNVTLEPEVFSMLDRLSADDGLRDCRVLSGQFDGHPAFAAVAQACAWAAERFLGEEAVRTADDRLLDLMPSLFDHVSGSVNGAVLKDLGHAFYHLIGEVPENCMKIAMEYNHRAAFLRVLLDWLESAATEWAQGFGTTRSPALNVKLRALLSLGTCLSMASPNMFARAAVPQRFIRVLGRILIDPPSSRCAMAAVTMISRLSMVDLDAEVISAGPEMKSPVLLIDAILDALRQEPSTQERVTRVVPAIRNLRGSQVIRSVRTLLLSEPGESEMTRGTVVHAAAQLLRNLLVHGQMSADDRADAWRLLHDAAQAPVNRRPLYRRTGFGTNDSRFSVVGAGSLADEISSIMAQVR
jgi:hypothetical protein